MAILRSRKVVLPETYALEIAPLPPVPDGEQHAYRLALTHNDEVVYEREHRVRGWATHLGISHIHVYQIARAFQEAEKLVDAGSYVRFLTQNGKGSISVGAGWVEFVLWGLIHPNPRLGQLFHVEVYLVDQAGGGAPLPRYLRATFICSPQEAIRFGKELEAECDAAEERRGELGI